MNRLLGLITCFLAVTCVRAADLNLVWPTPNTGWADRKPIEAYIQHAGSGDAESGTFGGVRSGGHQFHEGIDIKAVARDRRGEPTDSVFAALDGVVRHISAVAGNSNYGRYIVLEHPDQTPGVYTLYAHLAQIAPGLRAGNSVKAGQVIGLMGHSSDSVIPRDRAHLHFEVGLMVTRDFQSWYNRKKFGSRNEQGFWNGMNLRGIDPLALFNGWRDGRIRSMQDAFAQMPTVVRLRLATTRMPDFVARYPSLLTKPLPAGPVAGWEIGFDWTGVPISWTPLTGMEVLGMPRDRPTIMDVKADIERRERSRTLVRQRRGAWVVDKDLESVLQQLFGI